MFIRLRQALLSAIFSACAVWMLGCSDNTLSEAFSEKFIPGAPDNVKASAVASSYSSSNSITVTWLDVDGAVGYYVYRCSTYAYGDYIKVGYSSYSASSSTSSPASSYTDNGLAFGTTYYYKVSSYNNIGESSQSSSSNGVTTRPAAPSNVRATVQSSGSAIDVSWSSATGATGYRVYRSTETSGTYTLVGTTTSATSYTDNSLASGTTYYYRVSAYNSSGEGPQSSASSGVITKPAASSNVSAKATSSSSITVSWYSVTGATGYRVYRGTSASGTYTQVGTASSTSYTDNNLSPGTTYYYKVSSYNSAGESSQSSYVSATTIPAAPSSISATYQSSSGVINVSWNSVTGANGYRVYRSTESYGTYTQVGTTTSSTSYTDNSLSSGTTYYYRISAYNGSGESSQSSASGGVTTKPAAPSNVSATLQSSGSSAGITVSWYSVTGVVTGYRVYRSTSASGTYTQLGTVSSSLSTSYTDNSLVLGTTYYYKVSAYNSAGEGPQSSESNGVPTTLPAPSSVSATLQSSGSSVVVSWDAVTGATGYKVYRSTSASGSYTPVETVSSTSYTDNSPPSGATCYYKVSAYNDVGESLQSSASNGVTTTIAAPSSVSATYQSSNGGVINVIWSSVTGATGYRVYRTDDPDDPYSYTQVGVTTTSTSYIDNNSLLSGVTYYYKVSAYNSAGESSLSTLYGSATVP